MIEKMNLGRVNNGKDGVSWKEVANSRFLGFIQGRGKEDLRKGKHKRGAVYKYSQGPPKSWEMLSASRPR